MSNHFLHAILIGGLAFSTAGAQTNPNPTTGNTGQGTTRTQDPDRRMPQTNPRPAGTAAGEEAHPSGHVAGAVGEESMVGKPDQNFLQKAAKSSMMEVQLAQMAQEKASSEQVKEYAQKLEEDHKKANEKLKEIAEQRGISLPSEEAAEQDKSMQRLSNLSGEQFDRAFMKMQIQHHKKDIKEFQRASNRAMDSSVKEFASEQLPVLQEHLRQAQSIAGSGTRSRQANPQQADPQSDQKPNRQQN